MKHAIIFDLDNTIFPVPSIGDELFAPLFKLIESKHATNDQFSSIRKDIMRKPFQWVAEHYSFSESLTREGIELLKTLEHKGKISAFPDFEIMLDLPADKFLVTTGFTKMQESKVEALGLKSKFKKIFIIDPTLTGIVKKDVFAEILDSYGYDREEVIIIGDDVDSEIKAARALAIESVLYDPAGKHSTHEATFVVRSYYELVAEDILD